jgi:protein-S-isoprenylcysteine O-methyltransferase Ste14
VSAAAAALWLCALNLLLVAALPRIFFRPGRLNTQWWLTAAPFFVAGVAVLGAAANAFPPPLASAIPAVGPAAALPLCALALSAASIALIAFTLGTHREPIALWHQHDDAPRSIVRHGAYARIRHPFYAAFHIALAACILAAPGVLTVAAFLAAAVQLRRTAVREERRLLASEFGAVYADYVARTGRFFPRIQPSRGAPVRT